MRKDLIVASLAVTAVFPAQSAPIEEINCPLEILSESEFEALVDWVTENGSSSDPRIAALSNAAGTCTRRHGWSQSDFNWAIQFTTALANTAILSQELRSRGIDSERIEFIILADDEFLRAMRSMEISEQVIMDMIYRNLTALEDVVGQEFQDDILFGMIFQFAVARALQQVSREQFVAG
ncbi:MAG: hypothetical protein AAFW97_06195 [Pseudomonadota bacterium]